MAALYIRKIESVLSRPLSQSELAKAAEFCAAGYSLGYAIEYFK